MLRNNCLLLLFLVALPVFLHAQYKITGRVLDARTKESIPFATIRFGDSGQGMVAGLDGRFEVPAENATGITYLEVSCLGYRPKKVILPATDLNIYLETDDQSLREVTVTPPYDKMRRIINNAIANKNKNNPDLYDWYRCHVYYKMIVDATLPDSVLNDTSKEGRGVKEFFETQHLLMSETYSIRTWERPQKLQEDVIASRFSGLRKSVFTSLVTGIVPFHAYNDYIKLNSKDYHNPISRGFEQYYKFNLSDEILQGTDTVWVLSFSPKGHKTNDLVGKVYINSDGYAISQIVARASDTMLRLNVRIEQQYDRVAWNDSENRWFPKHLNYILEWQQKSGKSYITFHMKGNSKIDSVTWERTPGFHFDKAHTTRLDPNVDHHNDSDWAVMRDGPLDAKEARTYKVIDSLGDKIHADRIMGYLSKLPEGKIPLGPVDFDIKRFISANRYESLRLGLGLWTNEKLVKWLALGAWAGYGFNDHQWKWGVSAEAYADRYKEFVFRISYSDDINEPGRIHLNRDLDKVYLKYLLLNRVDETKEFAASVRKKMGYWTAELGGNMQDITPKYQYAFDYKGYSYTTYSANEASLILRYAYAERTAPFFNTYTRLGSRYPIWYGKITTGSVEGTNNLHIPYTQALSAVVWHKHINRIGFEHFLLEGGKSWSDGPLPLSKLFAGNGFKYDTRSDISIYTFGGMMTIYPYEYYTDQYVNFIFRHDFDWKLYKLETRDVHFSSAPYISLQYNFLYGTLAHPEAHEYVRFSIPDPGYNEVGLLLNSLLRLRFSDLYYLTLNMGYFYHITPTFDAKKNGRVVYGLGIEL
jgi:hypothetical protein